MTEQYDIYNVSDTFPSLEALRAQDADFAMAHAARVIAAREPMVRAWSHMAAAPQARHEAREKGPLAGVPFGVKDVIDVAGMPTRCGSPASHGAPAPFHGASVDLLVRAGAIPIGKTATAEYAFRHPGPTRNPHNLDHTPGGSSSGSAAAVAAGMVPFALSTQTGGSIIRPAAYCGVPGFKPSFGLVGRGGLQLTSDSLDTIGWHAASVAWTRACAQVLLPVPAQPAAPQLEGARVAVVTFSAEAKLGDEADGALRAAADVLEAEGARCAPANARELLTLLAQAHGVIMKYEFARNLAPIARNNSHLLTPSLLENIREGWQVPHERYLEMRARQAELRSAWHALAGDADFIITPSAMDPAPRGLSYAGAPFFNKCWTVLGWPCLHLPVRTSSAGLPLGVQLVGPWGQDFSLIEYGDQLESRLSVEGATNEKTTS